MIFWFITLALKKPFPCKEKSNTAMQNVPAIVRSQIECKRASCISEFELLVKLFKKGPPFRDESWQTPEGREKLVRKVVDVVNTYEKEVADVLFKHPVFATAYHYHWDSSLLEDVDILFDDFRYDLQCMYYNIAALIMNMVQYIISSQTHLGTAVQIEKESYRLLLQAAGYFSLLNEMAKDVKAYLVGDPKLSRPQDIQSGFLECFKLIALAQAQEIGMKKAIENEATGVKGMVTKLSHQIFLWYQEALDVAQKSITSTKDGYVDIVLFLQLKIDIFKALTFSYAGNDAFDTNCGEGLWFFSQSENFFKNVDNACDRIRAKKKIPFSGKDLIKKYADIVRRNSERCTRINSLVHRAKTAEGPVSLPLPYVLAHLKEVDLPAKFPHQVAQSLPSAPTNNKPPQTSV